MIALINNVITLINIVIRFFDADLSLLLCFSETEV